MEKKEKPMTLVIDYFDDESALAFAIQTISALSGQLSKERTASMDKAELVARELKTAISERDGIRRDFANATQEAKNKAELAARELSAAINERDEVCKNLANTTQEAKNKAELAARELSTATRERDEVCKDLANTTQEAKNNAELAARELSTAITERDEARKDLATANQKIQQLTDILFNTVKGTLIRLLSLVKTAKNQSKNEYLLKFLDGIYYKDSQFNCPGISQLVEMDSVEKIIGTLSVGDSAMSRLISLLWWYQQKNICHQLEKEIPVISKMVGIIDNLLLLFKACGYHIHVPNGAFNRSIENYDNYKNGKTRLTQIFPSAQLEEFTLCEIYQLSHDEERGKCYFV